MESGLVRPQYLGISLDFSTRFDIGDTVYIKNPDAREPEPVEITDIHIHFSSRLKVSYSVSYRGVTEAKQKDFYESELGVFEEAHRLFLEKHHPDQLEGSFLGDLPRKKPTPQEQEQHTYYPPQFRP